MSSDQQSRALDVVRRFCGVRLLRRRAQEHGRLSVARQYAVIEAIQTGGIRERFVIAYGREDSLRELLASACIVAAGFSSREEAAKNLPNCRITKGA